jgi:hypothetical protein
MKNYLVVTATKNETTGEYENFKGYKEYAKKEVALKNAWTRNQLISKQVFGIVHLVYDRKENQLLKSEKVA